MMTFRHAGDRGDLIASLPVVRHMGGGIMYIEAATYTRECLLPENWNGLDLLLKQQPYIQEVYPWPGGQVRAHVNLNDFRPRLMRALRINSFRDKSLVDWMLETHGVPATAKETPWLQVKTPKKIASIVFNRTGPGRARHHVYHNIEFPWRRVWDKYHDSAVFIGTPHEHAIFCATVGDVPYYKTGNLLEAAEVIAGCDLFVGNQSCCFWIACGMFKPIVLEVWREGPNCSVLRKNIYHGMDVNVELPDL